MSRKILFSRSFKMFLLERKKCEQCLHNLLKIVCTLDSHTTVFQADKGIKRMCRVGWGKDIKRRLINICSDSKVAFQTFDLTYINSKEVMSCRLKLEMLAANNEIRMIWVPEHSEIIGNEKAAIVYTEKPT